MHLLPALFQKRLVCASTECRRCDFVYVSVTSENAEACHHTTGAFGCEFVRWNGGSVELR